MRPGRSQRTGVGAGAGKALQRPAGSGLVAAAGMVVENGPPHGIEFNGAGPDAAPDVSEDEHSRTRGCPRKYSALDHYERKATGVFDLSVLRRADTAAIYRAERRNRNYRRRAGMC